MSTFKRVRAVLRALLPAGVIVGVVFGLGGPFNLWVDGNVAHAKTPGSTYCFYGKCHRVKTLSEMQTLIGKDVSLYSSHYDSCHRDRYNPCGLTSSGEPFFADRADNAASPIYPDGTKLLVWSARSKEAAVLRINNAGPYWGNRKLDVSRALARKLGFEHRGVAKLQVRVLSVPTKSEARYKRNRRYAKVHGPIGKFASLDEAENGLAVLLAFEVMTTALMAPAGGGVVTQVVRPFEVAASVTQGKAFAEVSPDFEQWPVVWRQYAALEWPVVGTLPAESNNAPVQVASASIQNTPAIAWPVVRTPEKARDDAPLVRLAVAWPVVTGQVNKPRTAGSRVSRLRRARQTGQPLRRKRQVAIRKARKVRLAALRSKQMSRMKIRKAQRTKARKKSKTGVKTKTMSKSKTKAVAKAKVKRTAKRVVRPAKPVITVRPHVATRQILHRALGRGA